VFGKLLNECDDLLTRIGRNPFNLSAQDLDHLIDRALSVKELPHVNTGRAQAKTAACVRVKKNCPVVKLLPEHDIRVGDRFPVSLHVHRLNDRVNR
jgi:hypothetical protein